MKSSKLILHLILIWFTTAIVATNASAKEISSRLNHSKYDLSFEPGTLINPLKPADTSSPLDTLQSFFTDMEIVLNESINATEYETVINCNYGYLLFYTTQVSGKLSQCSVVFVEPLRYSVQSNDCPMAWLRFSVALTHTPQPVKSLGPGGNMGRSPY